MVKRLQQFRIDGDGTPLAVKCHRCHRPLKVPESVARGYGPICWAKLESEYERDHRGGFGPRTITDASRAAISIMEFRGWVFDHLTHDHCHCGTPFEDCDLESYDYGDSEAGYKLPGFAHNQWFYFHCPKCKNDTAIWKIVAVRFRS
jgi:Family of unknown function (DUF6011)